MTTNDIIQYTVVAVVIILAVVWMIRRAKRKDCNSCGCGCSDCSIANKCDKDKKDTL